MRIVVENIEYVCVFPGEYGGRFPRGAWKSMSQTPDSYVQL